jgi:hypothetical protein
MLTSRLKTRARRLILAVVVVAIAAASWLTAALAGPTPGTTYRYRLVAMNSSDTSCGCDVTFTTTVRTAAPPTSSATAPAAAPLTLTAVRCVVPSLAGKTLPASRQVLLRAHCRLGAVAQKARKRHATPRSTLRVSWQSARPGSKRPAGFRVSVKLAAAARRSGLCFMSWCFSGPVEFGGGAGWRSAVDVAVTLSMLERRRG